MLPLRDDAPTGPSSYEGRRHLGGAFSIREDRIRPDPSQPRREIDETALAELTASVRKIGILQPITVRYIESDDIYQIIAGERRYRAAKEVGLSEIPCWVKTPKAEEVLLHQIAENWIRADLQPIEIAMSLATLRDANNYSQRQLAELTGKSEGEISKFLALLALDPAVQRQGHDRLLPRRQLYALTKLNSDEQRIVVATIAEQKLNAADTERLVREVVARRKSVPRRGAPTTRVQFATTQASVIVAFRRRNVTAEEIIAALDEARAKAAQQEPPLNIVRPK